MEFLEKWEQNKPRYRGRIERIKPRRGVRSLYLIYFHPRIIPRPTHMLEEDIYTYAYMYICINMYNIYVLNKIDIIIYRVFPVASNSTMFNENPQTVIFT